MEYQWGKQTKIPDSELQYLHCNLRASFGQLIANKTDNVMKDEQNKKVYPSLLQVKRCSRTTSDT